MSKRYLIYSVSKPHLALLCLKLGLDLDAPVSTWLDDPRLPDATLEQTLNHSSGIPDYGRLPEYHAAVAAHPSSPWSDDELIARSLALGRDFAPGDGYAYSNTGYVLVRRILELVSGGALQDAMRAEVLAPIGMHATGFALELDDLLGLEPSVPELRGTYHPGWVGHRTLISTVEDQRRFWTALAAGELWDLDVLRRGVASGSEHPGFVRPTSGLGLMTDPENPAGHMIGHGGAGPGYRAGCFVAGDRIGVELHADEGIDAQAIAIAHVSAAPNLAGHRE